MAADYTPTVNGNFKVEIEGLADANYISVSGIGGSVDISDDLGGGDKNARKVIGKVNYRPVTLVRNYDPSNKSLRDWYNQSEKGTPTKKSVSIVFYDATGSGEIQRRNLYNCVPSSWEISDLSTVSKGMLTESITFQYESAEWA